mgnify:CR=1 FL=1
MSILSAFLHFLYIIERYDSQGGIEDEEKACMDTW